MSSETSKRLLFVVNVDWFFVSHRLPIASAAAAAGYSVHVATAFDEGTRERLQNMGLETHAMCFSRSGAHPLELVRDFWQLLKLLRQFRSGVVHFVTLKPILLGGLAARLVGASSAVLAIPGRGTVFSARGPLAALRRWSALLAYRLAYRPGHTKVIVQNAEDHAYFVKRRIFRATDMRLIRGSGADVTSFRCEPERAGVPVVVFASRMLKAKGAEDFVHAARLLKERGVQARFALVGEPDHGNPHSHTREELEAWAASGAVEWWGFRSDMQAVFAESHVVCLPTYYGEGVPKVLIEAAAAGRPIVTSDIAGCRDIVRDGENGTLVPPRNPARLADELQTLLADASLRKRMGERGRALAVKEFSLSIVAQQTLDIYRELQ